MNKRLHDMRWLQVKRMAWSRAMMIRILADHAEAHLRIQYMDAQERFYQLYGDDSKTLVRMQSA